MITLLSQIIRAVANSCVSSVSYFLTSPYTGWFPVILLAVLASMSILILIYALAPIINWNNVRSWTKSKIFDLLITLVLIMSFGTVSTLICSSNPEPIFSSSGLIPTACSGSSVNNIYAISLCDLQQFNTYTLQFNQYLYFALLMFSITPDVGAYLTLGYSSTSSTFGASVSAKSGAAALDPFGKTNKFDGFALPLIFDFAVLSQVQLLLLAAAPLLFALFMAIGLIARSFEITRTFGNGMMAFGIGLGFIFPIIVSINYGFMDTAIQNALTLGFGSGVTATQAILPVVNPAITAISVVTGFFSGSGSLLGYAANILPEYLFAYIGLIVVGLTIIPVLTFTIVTTFISDFSHAMGETFDFESLFINLL